MLEFISDYDQPLAPPPTAIVACVPKKVHVDGVGETDFVITVEEITNAIKEGLQEPIYPEPEVLYETRLNWMYSKIESPNIDCSFFFVDSSVFLVVNITYIINFVTVIII